jgi:PAS domain S-box-containing protein
MEQSTLVEARMSEQPYRVLLVDDEPLILASYRRTLQSLGAQIHLAEGPEIGLDSLELAPADVVVADYRMPGMNGDEFLEQVRQKWPHTVRILVTAYTDVQMLEEVVRRGEIFRFLTKPCDTSKLRQAIQDALAQSKRQRERHQQTKKRELDLHSYRHMFESSLDPMMIADLDGSLLHVNEAFVRHYGATRPELPPRRMCLLSGSETDATWEEVSEALVKTGHWSGEIQRSGYVAILSISAINDDAGEAYAYAAVEKDVSARHRLEQQARAAQYEVIFALAKLAEYRDPETGAHLERMRRYSRILAQQMGRSQKYQWLISDEYVEAVYYSSPLHDIGKVGIPDSVLLKPGNLTAPEWKTMQGHTLIGAEVLSAAGETLSQKTWLSLALTIASQHHERFDGSGYPSGLKGTEIDLSARIVALADAYDAITSKRVYKAAMSHEIARQRIVAGSGGHFDPDVVDAFLQIEDEFIAIRNRFSDEQPVERNDDAPKQSVAL